MKNAALAALAPVEVEEGESIKFAEWIGDSGYEHEEGNKWIVYEKFNTGGAGDYEKHTYTTSELYHHFLQDKF